MKRLIATTAMAMILGTSAYAASETTAATGAETTAAQSFNAYTAKQAGDHYASTLIGMRIYAVENDFERFDENYRHSENSDVEWDDIGEINDIIVDRTGDVKAVILGVGGFLGIGEKDVAVQMDQLRFVRESDDADDYFLVVKASRDELTQAPAFDRTMAMDQPSKMDYADREVLTRPDIARQGYVEASMEELTAAKLTGTTVYDVNDQDIGEVDRLILTKTGEIDKVILDVGGFLGMSEKPVAMTFDELSIIRETNGNDFRVYVNASREQLEAQPSHRTN